MGVLKWMIGLHDLAQSTSVDRDSETEWLLRRYRLHGTSLKEIHCLRKLGAASVSSLMALVVPPHACLPPSEQMHHLWGL